ncbi:inositol monophosphatase family protein [Sphingomonas sp. ASV193]|uniref:inositol monophosphatase family protein n=1 Tax=Sphingomonas sp. ASV193 TaxID=3144405 RepID=UPI0032E8752E
MTDPDAAALIAFAEELARVARDETLPRFRTGLAADNKAGGGAFDPVTEADREAERAIREAIAARYPGHAIRGEEWPDRRGEGPWCWSLDPVDGTRSFICGLPTWVTLIGCLNDERPMVGLIDAPVLGETYVGDGDAAWLVAGEARTRLSASGCATLAEARFSTTDPALFEGEARAALDRIANRAKTVRYGHDGYAYARLAAGTLDLVVETGLKPFDYQALIPVVRGAGGVFADWAGGDGFDGGRVIAAATRELYEEARALLA